MDGAVANKTQPVWGMLGRFAALAACAIGLSACGSGGMGSSLFGGLGGGDAPPIRTVAVAPIVGAPPEVASQLASQVAAAAQQKDVQIGQQGEADYNLRGYLAAKNEPRGVKITYIWDVTDKAGARAHRITGEELVARRGNDMWAGVPGFASQRIAENTATQLAAWLKGGTAADPLPVATAPSREQPSGQAQLPDPGAAPQQQAAASPGEAATFIAPVSGAPGDGSGALQEAMRRRLVGRGLRIASTPNNGAYTVRGVVSLKEGEGGKENIRIDWQVIDPSGRRLGTVSQQNAIPKGSLNGAWGNVADAAAGAATDGVMKLLPKPSG